MYFLNSHFIAHLQNASRSILIMSIRCEMYFKVCVASFQYIEFITGNNLKEVSSLPHREK
jgi:hypothetical protein